MDDDALKTLVLAFERGFAPLPGPGMSYAFFNARPLAGADWRAGLICEQGFRPLYLDLESQGYVVNPVLPTSVDGVSVAGAIVLAGRLRAASEQAVARAWSTLAPGAPILVCGANQDGIQSLRKWVSARTPVEDSFSKHHAVAFVMRRGEDDAFAPPPGNPLELLSATMFSVRETDAGSQVLASYFAGRLAGAVADFGAGSGYLSGEAARQAGVTRLDLFEADWLSLQRARAALADCGVEVECRWRDLLREPVARDYDRVVMNPPFHDGRAARPEIGIRFIEVASRALKPGGRLLMVANRNLPYERALEAGFRRFEKLDEANGFKVFEAVR